MKNLYLIGLLIGALCLAPAVVFAASEGEDTNTLDGTNPTTREIDTMLVVDAFTVTSAERDASEAVEDPSTDLIVSSNAAWKIQAKVTAVNTNYGVLIKKDGDSYTAALTTVYADVSGATGANADNLTIQTTVKFDSIGWTDAVFTNETAVINIKILSS